MSQLSLTCYDMKLRITLVALAFILALRSDGFDKMADSTNYVVIGAFAIQKNAVRFVSQAKKLHFEARYEMNHARELYYVYVLITPFRLTAINEARKIRQATQYGDAWVFSGPLGDRPLGDNMAVDINPESQQTIKKVVPAEEIVDNSVAQKEEATQTETKPERKNAVVAPEGGRVFFFKVFKIGRAHV